MIHYLKETLKLTLIIILSCYFTNSFAQSATDTLNEKKYGFLPIVSFNSDMGFIGGLEVQEFDYRGNDLPFKKYTKAKVAYNSIGTFVIQFYRDRVRTLNSDVRSSYGFASYLSTGNYFPGITVREPFSKQKFDTTHYFNYNSFTFNGFISTRWPWYFGEYIERSDTKIGLELDYVNPFDLDKFSYLAEKKPTGYNYTLALLLDIGMIVERRNSEFQAQRGYSYGLTMKAALPWVSSNYFGSAGFAAAYYYPIVASAKFSLTWASRIALNYTFGDVPFWYLPYIGGNNLRGYMWLREVGYGSLNYSSELRSWLFSIPYKNIRLGWNLFTDGGTVYDRRINLANHHLLTVGFGGVMSIFTPDYIMKFDVGFSKEGMGIYLGTGYSF